MAVKTVSQRVQRRPEVLLVGDDDAFTHSLAQLLERSGYPVTMAVSAAMALAEVERGVDVVLCDLGASRMQAVEAALALRDRVVRDGAAENPVVVAISSLPNIAQHCRALGIRHYLAQPFRMKLLLQLLSEVTDEDQPSREPSALFELGRVRYLMAQ